MVDLVEFSKNISIETSSFLEKWFNSNDTVEIKTSGSTGKPKSIFLKKEFMINSAKATGLYFNLGGKSKVLLCMSANFIAGKMMIVRALTLGWHLDIIEPSSNPLKDIEKQYDFSAMVPLQLNNSFQKINQIKKLIVGGGEVSKELITKTQNIETEVYCTFGMTETITHIAIKKLNKFKNPELLSNSYYSILPNVSISKDDRGCLVIEAPNISEEIIVTNDLVEIISKNEFNWLGRFDNIINSGGIKLIPEQIEINLSKIVKSRFFVKGIPDEILGEKLILIIEGSTDKYLSKEILEKIKQSYLFTKYEIPKKIFWIQKFVETETNKINRHKTATLLRI